MPDFSGRAAIYYAPARTDPLWRQGCTWLGRDPETNESLPQPHGIAPLTTSPARYGFHATLKPPMRLKNGYDAFLAAVKSLAKTLKPFEMPPLEIRQISRFTALCLSTPSPAFQNLADRCVEALDPHRLPEDDATRQSRALGRTSRQLQNIARWGYPLVFEDWQFHITLSNAMDSTSLMESARQFFGQTLQAPRLVTELCVFIEPAAGQDFILEKRLKLE